MRHSRLVERAVQLAQIETPRLSTFADLVRGVCFAPIADLRGPRKRTLAEGPVQSTPYSCFGPKADLGACLKQPFRSIGRTRWKLTSASLLHKMTFKSLTGED